MKKLIQDLQAVDTVTFYNECFLSVNGKKVLSTF